MATLENRALHHDSRHYHTVDKRKGLAMRKSARYLGRDVGLNAEEVNVWLKEEGYLEGEPGDYRVTEKGRPYATQRHWETGSPNHAGYMFPRHGKRKSSMKLARFPRNADVSFPIRLQPIAPKRKGREKSGRHRLRQMAMTVLMTASAMAMMPPIRTVARWRLLRLP